jgi:hypothetical protein
MVGLVTVVAAATAVGTPAAAAKCVPGCYALAINEEMPRRLQVSSARKALLQWLMLCSRVNAVAGARRAGVLSTSGVELQSASSMVASSHVLHATTLAAMQ